MRIVHRTRPWTALAAALVFLDASLTFTNVWPTAAIQWGGELSIELAVFVVAMAVARRWIGAPSRTLLGWLSAAWLALVVGRYAEVTAPALYGRDVNLYWDLQFMPDVAAMVTRVAPWWVILAAATAVALTIWQLHRGVRWALDRVSAAIVHERERRVVAAFAAVTMAWFVGERLFARTPAPGEDDVRIFCPLPVTHTYVRQLQLLTTALSGSRMLEPSPPMDSDFSQIRGADVFVVFVESYGAVSFDRPDVAAGLVASRSTLDAAIRATHRDVVSAYVESPTFGGGSWLAHVSLMSGIEVRDPDTNALLMTQNRDTLARAFARGGYRTVALMPGLRQTWPEGRFYGFDEIYGADRLAYRGPEFGWFAIPDQFSLDRLDAFEVSRPSRPPLFVFFPTISTHFPFSPTPPYQPDWSRMIDERPYDGDAIVRAYEGEPDWTDFRPGYVEAMAYAFDSLEGYLRKQSTRDLVMIVLGDHQPPAAVSGEHARWDVPVHVIASRPSLLNELRASGFRPGLTPALRPVGKMHTLLPLLLGVFGTLN